TQNKAPHSIDCNERPAPALECWWRSRSRRRAESEQQLLLSTPPSSEPCTRHIVAQSTPVQASTESRPSRARFSGSPRPRQGSRFARPAARAGGLDGPLGRARKRRLRDGPANPMWEAMDEITSSDVDHVAIDRCRELLEDDGIGLSDEEVVRVRRHADVVARIVIELFLESRKTTH